LIKKFDYVLIIIYFDSIVKIQFLIQFIEDFLLKIKLILRPIN